MGRIYTVGIDEPDPHDPENHGVDPDARHDNGWDD